MVGILYILSYNSYLEMFISSYAGDKLGFRDFELLIKCHESILIQIFRLQA